MNMAVLRETLVAGDWLFHDTWGDGEPSYRKAYRAFAHAGSQRDHGPNFFAPLVDRATAEEVVRDQEAIAATTREVDRLRWDGDTLVQVMGDWAPGDEYRFEPMGDGLYELDFGWPWSEVTPEEVSA